MSQQPPYGWVPGKENYRPIRTLFECALYNRYFRVTCWQCKHSVILDAPGHWWRCEQHGLSDSIGAFFRRLHCSQCFKKSGIKIRQPKVEQTGEEPKGTLLPGQIIIHGSGSSTGNGRKGPDVCNLYTLRIESWNSVFGKSLAEVMAGENLPPPDVGQSWHCDHVGQDRSQNDMGIPFGLEGQGWAAPQTKAGKQCQVRQAQQPVLECKRSRSAMSNTA